MKRIAAIILFFLLSFSAYSQSWRRNRLEAYLGVPSTLYFGDIGGSADNNNAMGLKDISFKSIRPGIIGGATMQYTDRVCFNAKLVAAIWTQSDKGSRNELRNNSFSTLGTEISVNAIYYIISENHQGIFHNIASLRNGTNRKISSPLSLYVFTGFGTNFYTVKAKDALINDPRFDNSEKVTLLIPIGIGAKLQLWPQTSLGFELGGRYLFTDTFDGFTTQSSKANDVYYVTSITLHYRFLRNNTFKSQRNKFIF